VHDHRSGGTCPPTNQWTELLHLSNKYLYLPPNVHVLAEQVQRAVIDGVKEAKYISLAIDESTDNTDISQLWVFVRYYDGKDFREELLALLPLEDNSTADIIFGKLEDFFKSHGLSLDKINLTVTDGAPAMIVINKGLVSRIKTVAPKTNALHCIIHQSVLCAKVKRAQRGDGKNNENY